MATVGKEAQRAELHKTIWRIANDLRGSVDGWDFKTYVLGMLFYRFISENLTAYLNEQERKAGNADFDYAALSDADAEFGRAETVDEKGFYILPSELFANVRERARHDENLNETLARVFRNIEGSAVGTDERGRPQGPVRRPRRQQRASSARRSPSATRSSSSCSTPSATSTSATSPTTRSTPSATPTST